LWDLKRILNLDPFKYSCAWVKDYLKTNSEVKAEQNQHLCR
jgi:hypothetical protein